MIRCEHNLAEKETDCADGYCPICLLLRIKELEEGIEELLCNFSEHLPGIVIEGLQKLLEE